MPAAFLIGEEVEVRSSEDGLQGSWYEATVTRSLLRRRFYDVQYATLLADDHSSRPLIETVRASHLRPRAPRLAPAAGYAVDDLVDAFHNDGWWPGIVSATDGTAPPGRYTVCFPTTREVIEFAPSEIRPRLQWRHGHWLPHQNMEEAMFREGEQVEVSGDKENYGTTWFMATVVKVIAKTIYLVEYRKPKSDGGHDLLREFLDVQYVRPVPPSTSEGKHFALHEEIEVCVRGVWIVGVILKMVGNSRYTVKLRSPKEEELELSHSEMRRICMWINGQWECDTEDLKGRSKAETKKKRGRPRKQSTESIINMNVACTELEQPKRTGNGVADSKDTNKGVTLSNRDLLHNDASNTKANTQLGQQVARDLIQMASFAKDGTSPSFFTENVQEPSSFANGLNDTAIEVETRDLPPTLKEDCALAPDLTPRMASVAQDAIGTSASFLMGNLQDVSNFTYGLNDTANGVGNRSLSSSPKEDCIVARSNSYDPGVCGTSRFGSMHDIEEVEAEITYRQSESADVTDKNQTSSMPPSRSVNVEEMGLTDPSPIASTTARTLPFVKHSSLWEEIDSMEVFRIMPQKPHFHALEQQYSRVFREGMAIGLMVTFANLEAGMRKLDVFDSQASFEEKLKILKQLDDNGLNIQSLRSRIQKLLDKRNIIHELQNKENRLKELMFQRENEKDRIEAEENGVAKRLKEAEKHLASLSERRESLHVQQLELRKALQAMQEAYLSAERQFHTIVASLW